MNRLNRTHHQAQVLDFLQKQFLNRDWNLSLPNGRGGETYYAHCSDRAFFVKLGVQLPRYQAMAALGLTPALLEAGFLDDGTAIVVQPFISGSNPTRKDYRIHLDQFARIIDRAHHSLAVQQTLPAVAAQDYHSVGMEALNRLHQRWLVFRSQLPGVASFIDESLAYLAGQIDSFSGVGLVASHNDICNANWLLAPGGRLYLTDLESMSMDDPAVDIGATLWWYYPPALRQRFLEIVGYAGDEQFEFRMRIRMALHCLAITLPRAQSFDHFDAEGFAESLADFRAILANQENPQGYADGI